MKHKWLLTVATILFSIVVALAIFLLIWFWGDSYADFDEFSMGVEIPGLDEGAVPQGLASYYTGYTLENEDGTTRTGKQDYYFISAYMKSGPSRIYVTGEKTGYVGYVTMTLDGEDFTGHCGGVATSGSTLWVASDGFVYVAKRSATSYTNIAEEVIAKATANGKLLGGTNESDDGEESGGDAQQLQTIAFTAQFNANCNASFCYYYSAGNKLYVGEFYRKGNYETDLSHRMTTPSGDYNTAVVYEYTVSSSTTYKYGLTTLTNTNISDENKVPKIQRIYSITGQIQGFARTESGAIVLSQSYGLSPSHLLYYDYTKVNANSSKYNAVEGMYNFTYAGIETVNHNAVTDSSLYVYFIDGAALLRDYTLPSMTEGLCVTNDGKVNVLFESGCYKYKLFVRQQTMNLYAFTPKKKD